MTRQPGLEVYEEHGHYPPLVRAAVQLTRDHGCSLACLPEVGRLLQLMAATVTTGNIAELGTAFGVGTAWMASGMSPSVRLVSVERGPVRARAAADLFTPLENVEVLCGDWTESRRSAPYALIFSDGGPKREPDAPDLLAPLLRPGGLVVLDDFTPESVWTDQERQEWSQDPTRLIWSEHPGYLCTEVQLSARASVLLAVRRPWRG
jgi:predicted O-methyltransferase YrrM